MGQLTFLLFLSLLILSSLMAYSFYKQGKFLTSLFCLSFSLKVLLFFMMETGIKYVFALDSLKYEMDAWNLMKAELSDTKYILEAFETTEYLNPFTTIILNVFYVFGKIPQIVTLLNMFFSLSIYFFCIKITALFLGDASNLQKNKTILFLSGFLFSYPSLNIWSVTNTKDPAALFFLIAGLYLLFFVKRNYAASNKLFHTSLILVALGSVYISHLFRPYILPIVCSAFILGAFMCLIKKKCSLQATFALIALAATASIFLLEYTQPDLFLVLSENVFKARAGFLNENWADDASKSAFLVNYKFGSTWDYILFVPQGLAHYFFGPFLWDITSFSEALGLLEVLFIVLLVKPFLRGLQILNQKNSYEFNVFLSIMILLSLSQSLIIGNMGTIFRHRTLTILIYLIISSVGAYYDKKKLQNR